MGLLGVPLNVGTAPIASVALGIAVDDTVHFLMTYRRQRSEHHDQRMAILNTLRLQGQPIIYVSLALAAAFLVLLFSNFVHLAYFGVFSALVMLVAMLSELVLTPALLYSKMTIPSMGPSKSHA
jgi:predicted RND superfamily exporter protein